MVCHLGITQNKLHESKDLSAASRGQYYSIRSGGQRKTLGLYLPPITKLCRPKANLRRLRRNRCCSETSPRLGDDFCLPLSRPARSVAYVQLPNSVWSGFAFQTCFSFPKTKKQKRCGFSPCLRLALVQLLSPRLARRQLAG